MKHFFSLLGLTVALTLLSVVCFGATAPIYGSGNVLAGANFNDGPSSSDMTLIVRLDGDGDIYVNEGHAVKYITDPDNEGVEGWTAISFNDSAWTDGVSGVGFSDGDDNTVTPSGLMSIWTRYYFDAPNAGSISALTLLVDYDDASMVWLNGVLIYASANAPEGDPPAWDAAAGGLSDNVSACELAAGTPNDARWSEADIETVEVDFRYDGTTAVAADGKLAITWGSLKK